MNGIWWQEQSLETVLYGGREAGVFVNLAVTTHNSSEMKSFYSMCQFTNTENSIIVRLALRN